MEPFVVDGRVDQEQLYALLAAQAEYPTLDDKHACDLGEAKGRAEFVNDAAAMMTNPGGGYLVVGVDGRGAAVGATVDGRAFDSARLKDLLTKHLEGEVPVISQLHNTDAGEVVVMYLGRRTDQLFPVVKADMTDVDATRKEVTCAPVRLRARRHELATLAHPGPARAARPLCRRNPRPGARAVRKEPDRASKRQQEGNLAHGPFSSITWELPASRPPRRAGECRCVDGTKDPWNTTGREARPSGTPTRQQNYGQPSHTVTAKPIGGSGLKCGLRRRAQCRRLGKLSVGGLAAVPRHSRLRSHMQSMEGGR